MPMQNRAGAAADVLSRGARTFGMPPPRTGQSLSSDRTPELGQYTYCNIYTLHIAISIVLQPALLMGGRGS